MNFLIAMDKKWDKRLEKWDERDKKWEGDRCQSKESIEVELKPVSYTHLDVYKRQVLLDSKYSHVRLRICLIRRNV